VLIKTADGTFADIAALDATYDVDPTVEGPGHDTEYRGVLGFTCFRQKDGRLVLVNSRHVLTVSAEGDGCEIATRGRKIVVECPAEQAAAWLNSSMRRANA